MGLGGGVGGAVNVQQYLHPGLTQKGECKTTFGWHGDVNMSIAISHARTRNALLIIEHKLCKTRRELFSLKIACGMGS